jgi:thioredoxin-dependent peroxiredoxin
MPMRQPLRVGAKAPDFVLPRDGGGKVSLANLRGRKVALYFYPRADTAGCTKEALGFNALRKAFEEAETVVLGVSADPLKAIDKFRDKYSLTFALASDETHRMLEAYGAWGEKRMYGRTFMGVARRTYLIDRNGKIAAIWPKVKVDGHAEEVLRAAKSL